MSQARIDAVTEYLTGKGVDHRKIMSSSMGCEIPVTSNPDETFEQNRRMTIYSIRND